MNTPLHRPKPLRGTSAKSIDRSMDPEKAARALIAGKTLRVTDHYRTGTVILEHLEHLLKKPSFNSPYAERLAHGRKFREVALRLLAPIQNHAVQLVEAEPIGFLAEMYPDQDFYCLPLVEVQSLHGAWQRYERGVHLAVLGRRLHPFYGTYAPTRTAHLELFATWLSQYAGPRNLGVDVGTGCGVLALMLVRAGFSSVVATDSNPNAIESVRRELERTDGASNLVLQCTDLLDGHTAPSDLIVFNPPWLAGVHDDLLDQALHFQPGLFARFFDQAAERLGPDGRVVLIFSNIMRLMQPEVPHPIDEELAGSRFRLVQKLQRKVKPSPGPDGRRRRTREKVDIWELALTSE